MEQIIFIARYRREAALWACTKAKLELQIFGNVFMRITFPRCKRNIDFMVKNMSFLHKSIMDRVVIINNSSLKSRDKSVETPGGYLN